MDLERRIERLEEGDGGLKCTTCGAREGGLGGLVHIYDADAPEEPPTVCPECGAPVNTISLPDNDRDDAEPDSPSPLCPRHADWNLFTEDMT